MVTGAQGWDPLDSGAVEPWSRGHGWVEEGGALEEGAVLHGEFQVRLSVHVWLEMG